MNDIKTVSETARLVERVRAGLPDSATGEIPTRKDEAMAHRALRDLEARITVYEEALTFYGDPDTYFAIGFLPDRPCGKFEDDFEELTGALGHPDGSPWVKPGKRARAALAAETQGGER